jgi:hypothetical protein
MFYLPLQVRYGLRCGYNSARHVTQRAVSVSNVCCSGLFPFTKNYGTGWKCNLLFVVRIISCFRELMGRNKIKLYHTHFKEWSKHVTGHVKSFTSLQTWNFEENLLHLFSSLLWAIGFQILEEAEFLQNCESLCNRYFQCTGCLKKSCKTLNTFTKFIHRTCKVFCKCHKVAKHSEFYLG